MITQSKVLKCIMPTTIQLQDVYHVLDVTCYFLHVGTSITCADRLEIWS